MDVKTQSTPVICSQPVIVNNQQEVSQFYEGLLTSAMRAVEKATDPSALAIDVVALRIIRNPNN